MRKYITFLGICIPAILCQACAQSTEDDLRDRILKYDLSTAVINAELAPTDGMFSWWPDEQISQYEESGNTIGEDLWLKLPPALGYRGDDFYRFDIHFSSVRKLSDTQYQAEGLTRCQGEISAFKGSIVIDSVKAGVSEYHNFKLPCIEGVVSGHYDFDVSDGCELVAKMQGVSEYQVLEYDSKLYYDAYMIVADSYCNNQYEGVWKDLETGETMKCNWGDFRVPDSKGLDIGCGEFKIPEKYRDNGWQIYEEGNWEKCAEDNRWWQRFWEDYGEAEQTAFLRSGMADVGIESLFSAERKVFGDYDEVWDALDILSGHRYDTGSNSILDAYYFHCLDMVVSGADGALAEGTAASCYKVLRTSTAYCIEYLRYHPNAMENFAASIAFNMNFSADAESECDELYTILKEDPEFAEKFVEKIR